jgi:hypothetical protein
MAFTLAGCGSQPPVGEGGEEADTARFELVMTRTDKQGRLVMSGSYDYARRQGSMTAKLLGTEAAETDVPTEVRFFGDRYYSENEWEGKTYWVAERDDDGTGYPSEVIVPFPGSDLDSRRALELILAAGEEKELGDEEVRGTAATHYRVKLDPKALSRELGGRPLDEEDGPFAINVWADDAGRVRRIRLEEETATLTYEFFDFGVSVDVERPPTDQVVTGAEFERITEPSPEEELELCMEELSKDECERMHAETK